ncbi:MAG: PilZ domain-containing protein [Pseudomonadota bacterium]
MNGKSVYGEQRSNKRKLLKVKALLKIDGMETVLGRTLDVAGDGLSLQLDSAVKPAELGMVGFELFHEGKMTSITARVRAQHCVLGSGGFKVGFQFVNLDLGMMAALGRYLK